MLQGISELAGSALPAGFEPRGLALDRSVAPPQICVFGNGLLCLASAWDAHITPQPSLQLNAVALGNPLSLAAGADGRHFRRVRDTAGMLGAFVEQPPIAGVELTHASVAGELGALVGEGRVRAVFGRPAPDYSAMPEDLHGLLLPPDPVFFGYAVTQMGGVSVYSEAAGRVEPCVQQTIGEAVMAVGTAPCMDAQNPRALTERAHRLWTRRPHRSTRSPRAVRQPRAAL